jgi:hypothetical protein
MKQQHHLEQQYLSPQKWAAITHQHRATSPGGKMK